MSGWRRSRRRFLESGLAGGSSLLGARLAGLPWGVGGVPRAAAADGKNRLLIFYMPNCSIRSAWAPEGGLDVAAGSGDATMFKLGPASAPLEVVREHMTMIEGLSPGSVEGDAHSSSHIRIMTGGAAFDPGASSQNLALLPSIDQILAERSPRLLGTTFRSLEICAHTRSDRDELHHRVISYDAPKQPRPPENEPLKLYRRLFGAKESIGGEPVIPPERQKLLRERKQGVLAFLEADLARLGAKVPAHQHAKLSSHLSGLKELEQLLLRDELDPAARLVPLAASELEGLPVNSSEKHAEIVEGFWRLTRAAFQLDLTRVVTFMFGTGNSYVSFKKFLDGIGDDRGIHSQAHGHKDEDLIKATQWYTTFVASVVKDLAELREADGSSMLDNTLVVLFSEVRQYHEHADLPFVLFGGRNLGGTGQGLQGGRLLRYADRKANDIWPVIAKAYGVTLDGFGDADHFSGPLPGLLR